MLASTATIALMKQTSTHHDPHYLLEHSGNFLTITLFDFGKPYQAAGKCWPTGHPSTDPIHP
ncbi:MAG: membrane-associated PAP2 superfamily phosphatase [Candidatus Azotimanducaceae bacterium]|jgi:membrane-associated PAP2 superfamily phosphatase